MKKLKRLLALVIAMAMVLSMSVAAFAEDSATAATGDGSITIKSPVMGASYKGYRVFDMTMNEAGDSFSYTIDNTNPFYSTVKAYAEEKDSSSAEPDKPINGLTLSRVTTITDKEVYNVSVDENVFNAQKFGQALEDNLSILDAAKLAARTYDPTYETDKTVVTETTAAELTFEDLALGYYLIVAGYPNYTNTGSISYYKTKADGTVPAADDEDAETYKVTKDINLEKEVTEEDSETHETVTKKVEKTRAELEAEAKAAATQAVTDIVTDKYVEKYIEANPDKFPGYNELSEADKAKAKESAKKQLEDSTKESVIHQYMEAVNKLQAGNSDINVQSQRLVFIDSTTPNAEIIEKNELDKWDVPVNPDNSAQYVPHEYGEPEGGKNIVVGYADAPTNKKPIYADWTEANVGDRIHYQLRVNAMNFIQTGTTNLANEDALQNKGDVKQVKEYILADTHKDGLTFDPSTNGGVDGKDTIKVSIVDGNNNVIKLNNEDQSWDYTKWSDLFFDDEALLSNGGGIVIPWVVVTEDPDVAANYKNVTTNTVKVWKDENHTVPEWVDENADPQVQKTKEVYICSKYDSDVTIVVDYTMTLTDKAVIDKPGNINTTQYGMNYVKPEDEKYEQPNPETPPENPPTKPDEEREKDTATVYTYALALKKVDEKKNTLAGATFAVKGLTVSTNDMSDGFYKVGKYDPKGTDYSVELKTDANGRLVLEGFSSSEEITIKEVKAPDGYNILTKPITVTPIKTGEEVVTTGTTTYYDKDKNAEGANVTGKVESKTHEKIYYKNGNRVAKIVVENGVPKYYGATDEDIINNEATFNTLIEGIVTNVDNGNTTEVTTLDAIITEAIEVINNKGTELPSTGGIGTTIFYVVGAILVIGAGVILITKRRMDA